MSTQGFQLDPSLAGLPLSILRKKYEELTPEERVRLGFVRPATAQEFQAAQQPQGAPADFGGPVYPSSTQPVISDDTDSGIPATPMPTGVSFQKQNATSGLPLNTINPPAAVLAAPGLRMVGAQFNPAAPYQKAAAPGAKFDPAAHYAAEDATADTSHATPAANTPSDPRTIWNPRIRNIPDPAANETSAAGAFYHGAKAGATLASVPASLGVTVPEAILGVGGGAVGSMAGKVVSDAAGLGDLGQEVSSDMGGLVGGGLAMKGGSWAAGKARAIYEALPEAAQKEVLGVVSPRLRNAGRLIEALTSGEAPPAPKPPTPPAAAAARASLPEGFTSRAPYVSPPGSVDNPAQAPAAPAPKGAVLNDPTESPLDAIAREGDIQGQLDAAHLKVLDQKIAANAPDRLKAIEARTDLLNRMQGISVDPTDVEARAQAGRTRKMSQPRTEVEAPTTTRKDLNLTPEDFLQQRQLQRTKAGAPTASPTELGNASPAASQAQEPTLREALANPNPTVKPAAVEQQLRDALGGSGPLKKNVPLRLQNLAGNEPVPASPTPVAAKAAATKTTSLPKDFSPVDSSVLKGYHYDPEVREFHSVTNAGDHYIHGDVSPAVAEDFEAADSKGKAWQKIRNNPLVAKVIDGQRIAYKPRNVSANPDGTLDPSTDLTTTWQQALDAQKARKLRDLQ